MSRNGVRYTEEFKQQIVELYKSGRSATELGSEYGVATVSIHKWIKQYTPIKVSEDQEMTIKELRALQKRIAELEMENEILKKATAIFARKQ